MIYFITFSCQHIIVLMMRSRILNTVLMHNFTPSSTLHYLLAFLMKFRQLKQIRTKLLVLSRLVIFFVRVVMFRTTQFIIEVHPWTCFPFLQAPMWLMKQTTLFISIWIRKRFYSLSLASTIVVATKLTAMRLWLCWCIQSSMYHRACIFDVM